MRLLTIAVSTSAIFAFLSAVVLLTRPALPQPTHHLFTTYGVMPADATCAYSGMGSGDEAYYCHAPLDDGFVSRAGYSVERGQVTRVYLTLDNLRTEALLASEGWPSRIHQWRQSIVMCWPTEFNGLEGALLATIRRDAWHSIVPTLYARFGGFYRGIRRWFDSTLNGVRGQVGWVRLELDQQAGWGCL